MPRETVNSRVAVLETKVEAINEKLEEVRDDIKQVHACIHKTRDLIITEIKALQEADNLAHKEMNLKISSLENWRWYIVGVSCAVAFAFKFIFH